MALLGFLHLAHILHLIPNRGGGSVTIVVQGIFTGFCIFMSEPQVFSDAVNNSPAAGMYTPIVNTAFEIGNIRRYL